MPYSDFTLETVKKKLQLQLQEHIDLFVGVPERSPSDLLSETLAYNVPLALAVNTEKSRSELIIAPILLELRRQSESKISFFSGIEFNIDPTLGLNGVCDFILSFASDQLIVTAPVVTIVEAKKENLNAGLGQCMAEMFAAQRFNEKEERNIPEIYGAVTTGNLWKFLRLKQKIVEIDLTEYSVHQINQILGILSLCLNNESR
ncbi:MAG: hypothetical protein ACFBSF_08245 [Leptolyngbyaceae cyanobacterium]